ncbi:hypothetical protein HBB16_08445 [Pseudonocardia sp. MCCB 268]|nr:hypothetical protein [Pseudonocardia cytotoxica]
MLAVNPMLMSAYGLESQLALTPLVGAVGGRDRAPHRGRPDRGLVLTRPDLGPSALVVAALVWGGGVRRGCARGDGSVVRRVRWWLLGGPGHRGHQGPESWAAPRSEQRPALLVDPLPGPVALSAVPAAAGLVAWAWWWRERLAWVRAGRRRALRDDVALHPGPLLAQHVLAVRSGLSARTAVACVSRGAVLPASRRACSPLRTCSAPPDRINDGPPRGEFAPISFNRATPAQYAVLAARLPAGATVLSPGRSARSPGSASAGSSTSSRTGGGSRRCWRSGSRPRAR